MQQQQEQQQQQQEQQQQQQEQQQQQSRRSRRVRNKIRFLRKYKNFIKHVLETYEYPIESLEDNLERTCIKCGKKKQIEEVTQVCERKHFICTDCYLQEINKFYVEEPIFYIPCTRCKRPSLILAYAVDQ